MDRTPDRLSAKIEAVRSFVPILPDDVKAKLVEMFHAPEPAMLKCQTLYGLANKFAETGHIVELGAYHGEGAITLSYGLHNAGKNNMVLTVDQYTDSKGWANEPYTPHDEDVFWRNVHTAGFTIPLLHHDVESAAAIYRSLYTPLISLLFWDLGMPSGIETTLGHWIPNVLPGGIVAGHDTYNEILGVRSFLTSRSDLEYVQHPTASFWPGGIQIAVKR